jgi:hypothetical protein
MKKRKLNAEKIRIITIRVVIFCLFIIVATVLVGYAQGYKINRQKLLIEATGAIYLQGSTKDVSIVVNDKLMTGVFPLYIRDLKPNQEYRVVITKIGYNPWIRTFHVNASLVESADNIKLFKKDYLPLESDEVNVDKICSANSPSDVEKLIVSGGELRSNQKLITRQSANIVTGCWFEDGSHVLYVVGRELRVVEVSGYNDTLIFKSPAQIKEAAILSNDSTINYKDDNDRWWKIVL